VKFGSWAGRGASARVSRHDLPERAARLRKHWKLRAIRTIVVAQGGIEEFWKPVEGTSSA